MNSLCHERDRQLRELKLEFDHQVAELTAAFDHRVAELEAELAEARRAYVELRTLSELWPGEHVPMQ
jgi:hypothetical protein